MYIYIPWEWRDDSLAWEEGGLLSFEPILAQFRQSLPWNPMRDRWRWPEYKGILIGFEPTQVWKSHRMMLPIVLAFACSRLRPLFQCSFYSSRENKKALVSRPFLNNTRAFFTLGHGISVWFRGSCGSCSVRPTMLWFWVTKMIRLKLFSYFFYFFGTFSSSFYFFYNFYYSNKNQIIHILCPII